MLDGLVREAARRHGEQPAFAGSFGQLTFSDLDRRSDRVAAGLAAQGITEGSVVALTIPSGPDYVVAYAALAKLGAVTAGVNPRFTEAERAACIEVIQPDLVINGDLPTGNGAVPELPDDPDRDVAIVLTSGTTGTPKGAVFTNAGLAAVTDGDVGDTWGGGADSPYGHAVASTQFAHVGFMTKLPGQLRTGTTFHVLERWRAADVLDLVERHRIPIIGAVAPQVALLLQVPDLDDRDLDCVRGLIVGAGPSPPALVREARQRFGAGYSIRYSSTESGGVGLATAFDAPDSEALHTVGRPRAQVTVEIRDQELYLRSPTSFDRYWRDPDATDEALVDGWLRTGDLAEIDEAGCVRLLGRRKEMYIRGGYNVYPMEVEAVLGALDQVASVAVTPRLDPVMGEIGEAVVVPADRDAPPSLDDLRAAAGEVLSHYKLPEAIRIVDELPYTTGGKLDRAAL